MFNLQCKLITAEYKTRNGIQQHITMLIPAFYSKAHIIHVVKKELGITADFNRYDKNAQRTLTCINIHYVNEAHRIVFSKVDSTSLPIDETITTEGAQNDA